jgi:hypothetical protein
MEPSAAESLTMLRRLLYPFVKPKTIIVVSGLPRSGTSMMMQMLAAGGLEILSDHQRPPDTNNPHGYYEFERVKKLREGDTDWLRLAQGRAVKIISALLEHLPDEHHYKIIFMQRDMTEILQSQQKMLIARGEATNRYTPDELTQHYQAHLQAVMAWLDQQANMSVLNMNHGDVLHDPIAQAEQITRFLECGLDASAMAAAVDASLYRNKTHPPVRKEPGH